MNPTFSNLSPEERDARITSLLLGELAPAEAEELRAVIAADPELARACARRERTIALLREAACRQHPAGETRATEDRQQDAGGTLTGPARLSDERREKLLAKFRSAARRRSRRTRRPLRVKIPLWSVPMSIAAVLVGLLVVSVTELGHFGLWPSVVERESSPFETRPYVTGTYFSDPVAEKDAKDPRDTRVQLSGQTANRLINLSASGNPITVEHRESTEGLVEGSMMAGVPHEVAALGLQGRPQDKTLSEAEEKRPHSYYSVVALPSIPAASDNGRIAKGAIDGEDFIGLHVVTDIDSITPLAQSGVAATPAAPNLSGGFGQGAQTAWFKSPAVASAAGDKVVALPADVAPLIVMDSTSTIRFENNAPAVSANYAANDANGIGTFSTAAAPVPPMEYRFGLYAAGAAPERPSVAPVATPAPVKPAPQPVAKPDPQRGPAIVSGSQISLADAAGRNTVTVGAIDSYADGIQKHFNISNPVNPLDTGVDATRPDRTAQWNFENVGAIVVSNAVVSQPNVEFTSPPLGDAFAFSFGRPEGERSGGRGGRGNGGRGGGAGGNTFAGANTAPRSSLTLDRDTAVRSKALAGGYGGFGATELAGEPAPAKAGKVIVGGDANAVQLPLLSFDDSMFVKVPEGPIGNFKSEQRGDLPTHVAVESLADFDTDGLSSSGLQRTPRVSDEPGLGYFFRSNNGKDGAAALGEGRAGFGNRLSRVVVQGGAASAPVQAGSGVEAAASTSQNSFVVSARSREFFDDRNRGLVDDAKDLNINARFANPEQATAAQPVNEDLVQHASRAQPTPARPARPAPSVSVQGGAAPLLDAETKVAAKRSGATLFGPASPVTGDVGGAIALDPAGLPATLEKQQSAQLAGPGTVSFQWKVSPSLPERDESATVLAAGSFVESKRGFLAGASSREPKPLEDNKPSAETHVDQVLDGYAELTGKQLVKSPQVAADAKISIPNLEQLTKQQRIDTLTTVLGLNQIALVPEGDKFLKVVPMAGAATEAVPFAGEQKQRPTSAAPADGSKELTQLSEEVTQLRFIHDRVKQNIDLAETEGQSRTKGSVQIIDPAVGDSSERPTWWGRVSGKGVERNALVSIEQDLPDVTSKSVTVNLRAPVDPFFIQSEQQTIQSKPVLGRAVEKLKLNEAWAEKGKSLSTDQTVALLKKRLEVRQDKNTSLIDIRARGEDGAEAAAIANAVAEAYQEVRGKARADVARAGLANFKEQLAAQEKEIAAKTEELERRRQEFGVMRTDVPVAKPPPGAPIPQPEIQTRDNAFSTFSLNVSDVSFKLAGASLEKGAMPDVASIRSEEFINAFDYRDPMPRPGVPLAFALERARYPFAHNRDVVRFSIKTAAQGRESGKPLNLVLLLDNSGSMERADRVRIIQESLRALAAQLQPQDKLSIVTFARTASLRVDGASGTNAVEATQRVGALTPEGGTNLEDALNLAYRTALRHYAATAVNRIVLLTDGAANLGNVDPKALKAKVEDYRKQGIALDCFGIGWEGYNDDLLEQLSRNGDGRYGFVNTPEEAASEFVGQLAGALRVAASDVKMQVEFNPKRVTSWRQIGYAKHQLTKEQFRDNKVDAAEIGAAESGNALYVIETNPNGDGPIATVRARFRIPQTSDYREHEWIVPFGSAVELQQSSPSLRLAATAAAFSEWLASSPFAGEVTTDRLLQLLSGVPESCGADARPKRLEWMIRQAKSISGK